MKNKVIVTACTLLAMATASAQNAYDAEKLLGNDLNGTARFVGMGGAMGALGGDISVISSNPAGIGIFRSNDVSISFGFNNCTSATDALPCVRSRIRPQIRCKIGKIYQNRGNIRPTGELFRLPADDGRGAGISCGTTGRTTGNGAGNRDL